MMKAYLYVKRVAVLGPNIISMYFKYFPGLRPKDAQ